MTRAVALRLAAFAGVLGLAFAGAFALGSTVDPLAAAEPAPNTPGDHPDGMTDDMGDGMADAAGDHDNGSGDGSGEGHAAGHGGESATAALPGLAVSEAGYTLVPARTTFAAGRQESLRFTVVGPDGRPVTAYDRTHEKDLHLIVVRRDLSGFRHVHPTRAADGTWSIPFAFSTGGTWRLFADFRPTGLGRTLTLGSDVAVSGRYDPAPLPAASTTTSTDGYDVTLAGRPAAGKESELTFTVSRDGRPVEDLEPYLGAFGHLVSLRGGDLAYLHNHPAEEARPGDHGGPQVRFATTFPTAGTYRLFLDFQHSGAVHTAAFTVQVDADGNRTAVPPATNTPATPSPTTSTSPTTGPTTRTSPAKPRSSAGTPRRTPAHDTTPHGH